MSSKSNKPKSGSTCAVATCLYNKAKRDGKKIVFHRFPKNLEIQKQWAIKSKRKDNWNPSCSYVCADHFSENNFVQDLKTELLRYTPNKKRLNSDAIPTLNLPYDHVQIQSNVRNMAAINRQTRMESKSKIQKNHDQIIKSIDESLIQSSTLTHIHHHETTQPDYEQLYKTLYKDHAILKSEYIKIQEELSILKQYDYKSYESLRLNVKSLQTNLRRTNSMLKQTKTKMIETTAKKSLLSISISQSAGFNV